MKILNPYNMICDSGNEDILCIKYSTKNPEFSMFRYMEDNRKKYLKR